ncbi:MAG TPA: adenylosuccinate synthetase [Candidatus Saccharibacteria bacterium]|nr:adenylosuccinate synthetase [Candidatus Saccharibacteria bacterium]
MALDIVVGVQAGDEGKGLHVYRMAAEYHMVARFNGGANAGHTNFYNGQKVATHQVPSGIYYPRVLNVIGNGSLYDPVALFEDEIPELQRAGLRVTPSNLAISETAHMVLPHHRFMDAITEATAGKQGSTKRGIRYVGAEKYGRDGVRCEDINEDPDGILERATAGWDAAAEKLYSARDDILAGKSGEETWDQLIGQDFNKEFERWHAAAQATLPFLVETVGLVNDALDDGRDVLAEGAQSIGLDIEHGEYPLGTSSHATPAGALNGLGVSHKEVRTVYGIAKIFKSRVGGNGFPTMITDEALADNIRGKRGDRSGEYGASTGRPRDIGWFDLNDVRLAKSLGVNSLILTKGDCTNLAGDTMNVADYYALDGVAIRRTPSSAAKLARCLPHYVELPTWVVGSDARTPEDLPQAARDFVSFVEEETDTKVGIMGVGTDIDQIVTLR